MSFVKDCKLDIEATKRKIAKFTEGERAYSTLIEQVDCVLGRNHAVTVRLNNKQEVEYIGCSCYTYKEEVEGLILLGTDINKTCYGFMQAFVKHIRNISVNGRDFGGYYKPEGYEKYTASALYQVANAAKTVVAGKVRYRAAIKEQLLLLQNRESAVSRRLQSLIGVELGSIHECFRITQPENSIFAMYIREPRRSSRRSESNKSAIQIASREKGVWVVDSQWKEKLAETYNSSDCMICNLRGHAKHIRTTGHKRKAAKHLFIALQATSTAGMQMRKRKELDKNDNPKPFRYRHNQKHIPGVRIIGT